MFRIEDTDKERNTTESYDSLIDLMQWLGLDWDEGPLKGGDFGPYRQSERGDIYADVLARLRESSYTYDCYCTTDEVTARRKASGSKVMGYDGFCRELTDEQVDAFQDEGRRAGRPLPDARRRDHLHRPGARRHHLPDRVRPRLRARARQRRPPLHADRAGRRRHDADHPRPARRGPALQHARARSRSSRRSRRSASPRRPRSTATCPTSWARATRSSPSATPRRTWSSTASRASSPRACSTTSRCSAGRSRPDRDVFTLDEMVDAFDIKDVNPNPARFDLKKAEAINTSQLRLLPLDEITERCLPFLERAGVLDPADLPDRQLLDQAMPLVGERINKLTEAATCSASCSSTRRTSPAPTPSTTRDARSSRRRTTPCRPSSTGAPRRSTRRSARPSWRSAGSSRASPSARCGSRCRAGRSARRSSSRSSCWVASVRWRGSRDAMSA